MSYIHGIKNILSLLQKSCLLTNLLKWKSKHTTQKIWLEQVRCALLRAIHSALKHSKQHHRSRIMSRGAETRFFLLSGPGDLVTWWGMASLFCPSIEVDRAEPSLGERFDVVVWYALKMWPNSKQNMQGKRRCFCRRIWDVGKDCVNIVANGQETPQSVQQHQPGRRSTVWKAVHVDMLNKKTP